MTENTATPASVVLEYELAEPPQKVWRALTEPHLLAAWLGANDIRPEVGAEFKFDGDRDTRAPVHCRILEAQPNRRLRWCQWEQHDADAGSATVESVVSFELSVLPSGGTHLRLVHDTFATCPIVAMAGSSVDATNVVPLQSRRVRARRKATPTIVCALGSLRRAA